MKWGKTQLSCLKRLICWRYYIYYILINQQPKLLNIPHRSHCPVVWWFFFLSCLHPLPVVVPDFFQGHAVFPGLHQCAFSLLVPVWLSSLPIESQAFESDTECVFYFVNYLELTHINSMLLLLISMNAMRIRQPFKRVHFIELSNSTIWWVLIMCQCTKSLHILISFPTDLYGRNY